MVQCALTLAPLRLFRFLSPWLLLSDLGARPLASAQSLQPLASPAAIVRCDSFSRFSLLSPVMVRAEFSPTGEFEDRATLAFVNRRFAVPEFQVDNTSGWCNVTLTASGVKLAYRLGNPPPTKPMPTPPVRKPCSFGAIPIHGKALQGCATGRLEAAGNLQPVERKLRQCLHSCKHSDSTLAGAESLCAQLEDCNGVTLHDGRFECRRGPQLIPSPKGNPCNESTWVITNADQCHLNRTGVDRTGFATHALSLSMREGDTVTAAPTRMRTVWRAGVTSVAKLRANQRGGTVYQLDGVNGTHNLDGSTIDLKCKGSTSTVIYSADLGNECTPGVLSYGGWTIFSDHTNTVIDEDWWAPSVHYASGGEDLYLFATGKGKHMEAIRALTSVAGKVPPPPRRFFGVWWSRWNKYSELELRKIISEFERNLIPLDGINLDTEWHRNEGDYLDGDGERMYHGVYDWDQSLYGESPPQAMIDWLEARSLWPIWMDIHQADTSPVNSQFAMLAAALNRSTELAVPLEIGDQAYVKHWFELIDTQVGGRNYWWLDSPHLPGQLDDASDSHNGSTSKTNYMELNAELWNRRIFWNAVNQSKLGRPTVMGPWGGLGTHRMPFGHSGDTITSWQTLQFLPFFSATASNVLFSYISHDAGGHRDYGDGDDQEMYTRSVQYAVFSAQLRPHAAKLIGACKVEPCDIHFDRRPWMLPHEFFAPIRDAFQLRAQLVPYFYTAALTMWLDDTPFIRHAYIDFPSDRDAEELARIGGGYMIGPSILVIPVVTPRDNVTNLTTHTFTLPALPHGADGKPVAWVERGSGRCMLGGGGTVHSAYRLEETSEFVRGGSIVPMGPVPEQLRTDLSPNDTTTVDLLQSSARSHNCADGGSTSANVVGGAAHLPPTVHWHVYIGNSSTGSGVLLEDDGRTTRYQSGEYSRIIANYTLHEDEMTLIVQPAIGTYHDLVGLQRPSPRPMVFMVHNVLPPSLIHAGYTRTDFEGAATVTVAIEWDAATLTANVRVPAFDPAAGVTVRIGWDVGFAPQSDILCTATATRRPGFVALNARVLAIKRMIDWEAYLHTKPSMKLNYLVGATIRMERNHTCALDELTQFSSKIDAVVRLHTDGTQPGQPSPKLQAIIRAWLGP